MFIIKRKIKIKNVIYILGYIIKLLLSIRFKDKDAYFIFKFYYLYKDGKLIIFIERFNKYYILKNNLYFKNGTLINIKGIWIRLAITNK